MKVLILNTERALPNEGVIGLNEFNFSKKKKTLKFIRFFRYLEQKINTSNSTISLEQSSD